jgi:hypothetical protein
MNRLVRPNRPGLKAALRLTCVFVLAAAVGVGPLADLGSVELRGKGDPDRAIGPVEPGVGVAGVVEDLDGAVSKV